MRQLLREFKKTQPIGTRSECYRQMSGAYELAEPEVRKEMKRQVKAALAGEPIKNEYHGPGPTQVVSL